MLVTNHGQIIRIRVHGGEGDSIRIAGRKTQGVRLFDVSGDEDERVVSAGLIRDADDNEEDDSEENGADHSDTEAGDDQEGGTADGPDQSAIEE